MRSIAKARTAGSSMRQATDLGRNRIAFACVLALLAFSGFGASSALAGQTRLPEPFSPITGAGSEVTIHRPSGVAIDQSTGNVFVTDENGSSDAILILNGEDGKEGEAKPPVGLMPNAEGEYKITGVTISTSSQGLAYDNSESAAKGTLYFFQPGSIKKFTRNEVTEKYEAAGQIVAAGTGGAAGLAVDGEGNVYLGDFTSRRVRVWDPAGTLLHDYNFASSPTDRPSGIAVDSEGNLYVQRQGGSAVARYPVNGSGEIEVSTPEELLVSGPRDVAYDPVTDHVFVTQAQKVVEYDASSLDVVAEYGEGTLGNDTERLAVNSSTGRVYVADRTSGKLNVAVFAPPVPIPDVTTKAALDVKGVSATLNGVVNPQSVEVTECKYEYGLTTAYGKTAPCEGSLPTDSDDHAVTAEVTGLEPNGTTYHFRLVVDSENGEVKGGDRTLVTANTVFTEPASAVLDTTATLNGIVKPEGIPLDECTFEYGTTNAYGESAPCSPSAGSIPDDFGSHAVSADLTGLNPNTTYHFRLSATNAEDTVTGEELTFTTQGPPVVVEQLPLEVEQTSATIRAKINPAGSGTSYHFEWGPGTDYGNRIPQNFPVPIGAGTDPVTVSADLDEDDLDSATAYSFRVVATNAYGTTVGPDQPFETLNAAGLPNNRGYELVSPVDKGPSGSVSDVVGFSRQIYNQASVNGGEILYPIQNGIPDSTAGGWTRWLGRRTESGWLSTQLSPPALLPLSGSAIAQPSVVKFASPDLSCAIVQTHMPLTADTPQAGIELGVQNLYRWNAADGSYELITKQLPLNPGDNFDYARTYAQVDASDDCSRVYFLSGYEFIAGHSRLYEWDEGILRDGGLLPSGEVGDDIPIDLQNGGPAGAIAGGESPSLFPPVARWNAVSSLGSLFFTAISDDGGSGDFDTPAIYLRQNGGAQVIKVSRSQTEGSPGGVATNGARYEGASADGSVVVFRANHGIATNGSSAAPTGAMCGPIDDETEFENSHPLEDKACDLYLYDVESEELTDISLDENPADPIGAAVQGTIAINQDGSRVYFAALGQLIPGEGRTYAQNIDGDSANVYLYDNDSLTYVATLGHGDLTSGALMRIPDEWSAEASADGSRLVFESSASLSEYSLGGGRAAYLYDADADEIVCISCSPDGTPTAVPSNGHLLASSRDTFLGHRPRSISEDGSRVVFTSPDALAPGAEVGKRNVYLWDEGQVSFLAVAKPTAGNGLGEYLDMSADGADIFIATAEQLVPQDKDFVSDAYDVRVDGGFPFTPEPPKCQVNDTVPLEPNQAYCQDVSSPQPDQADPSSAGFRGAGNLSEKQIRNPCARRARRAQGLSRRAKALRRKAKSVGSARAKRRHSNRARGAAKAARRNSQAAKRCRRRARAANFDRGGSR